MKAFHRFELMPLAVILLTLITYSLPAQLPPPDPEKIEGKREEIEAMKIGFLTRKLDLSSNEAQAFWPVYNQFQDELEAIRKQRRNEMRDLWDNFKELNDKDAEKIIDNEIASRQKELDVMKKYHSKFKQILPVKKVLRLYRSEEEFKRELLERLRNRNDGPAGPPPRRR